MKSILIFLLCVLMPLAAVAEVLEKGILIEDGEITFLDDMTDLTGECLIIKAACWIFDGKRYCPRPVYTLTPFAGKFGEENECTGDEEPIPVVYPASKNNDFPSCQSCHDDDDSEFQYARYNGRGSQGLHDEHEGKIDTGEEQNCVACHNLKLK